MNDHIFRLHDEKVPTRAVIAAVLFAASLISILYFGNFVTP